MWGSDRKLGHISSAVEQQLNSNCCHELNLYSKLLDSALISGDAPYAPWRYRYVCLGIFLCLTLIGWGGWVTSIDAGLAVPDWPTSFGSLDPIATGFEDPANPESAWWMHAPVLAEHGHRLLGAVVGLWAMGLFLWVLVAERRRGVRLLAAGVLMLVILQGVLGGLRVIRVSLDLAVLHALGAQLFFASVMAMAVVSSAGWVRALKPLDVPQALKRLSIVTALALFVQILLGALLRHPGDGVHLGFILTHAAGSVAVLVLIFMLCGRLRRHGMLVRWAWGMMGGVALQMILGIMALVVLVYEESVGARSVWQISLNLAHLVTGTLLMGGAAGTALQLMRRRK